MKKFLPLSAILFCFSVIYTIVRDTKDTLIVNAGGATLIPVLKGAAGLLAIAFFIALYVRLVKIMSREKLFYIMITSFILFFAVFGFIIHPHADFFHPAKEAITALHAAHPAYAILIDVYAHWSYAVFYVFADLWGSIVLAFVFWEFANHIFSFSEAKRYYILFGFAASAALMASGFLVYFCSITLTEYVPAGMDAWHATMYVLMGVVVLMGALSLYAYHHMHKCARAGRGYFDAWENDRASVTTSDESWSWVRILRTPELWLIAILIMIGGVALNWIDVYWKGQLKIFFAGDKGGYNGFMGWFSGATGSLSLLFMVVGYFILRKCTWFTAAVIVPVVILISGSVFFIILLGADALQPVLTAFNLTTNAGIVYGGAAALILSKAVISAFFSPTKEMAYIPLPSEVKSKGRVIVDLCAGRLSKTAGACVYAMLLVASAASDVAYLIPYAFGAFVSLCLGWICVVKMLNHKIITALAGPERQG